MNTRIDDEKNFVLSRWIFKRSQSGKKQVDTHYSFLNLKNQAYVEDQNKILIEYDIVKSISFNGGISGRNVVLVDVENIFGNISFNKNRFKIRTGAQETHESCWRKDWVEMTESSNVSVPEMPLLKLTSFTISSSMSISLLLSTHV